MSFKKVKVTVEVDDTEYERVDLYHMHADTFGWSKVARVRYSMQKLMQDLVNTGVLADALETEGYSELAETCSEEGEEE